MSYCEEEEDLYVNVSGLAAAAEVAVPTGGLMKADYLYIT